MARDNSNVKPRNIEKVAEVLVKDPNTTHREIQEATGLASNTVQKAKDELKQTGSKDEIITYIVGGAKKRLKRIDGILNRFVEEAEAKDSLDRRDVSLVKDFAKDDLQRITVLGGDVTDDKGGLKDFKAMTPEQLYDFIESKGQQ